MAQIFAWNPESSSGIFQPEESSLSNTVQVSQGFPAETYFGSGLVFFFFFGFTVMTLRGGSGMLVLFMYFGG